MYSNFLGEHSGYLLLAAAAILITIGLTLFVLWRKRLIEPGPRKGEAARPGRVRHQNPPDR